MSKQSALGIQSIYTLGHLGRLTGVGYTYLRDVVSRKSDAYAVYAIRKRDGSSLRSIAAPEDRLQAVQRWLLDNAAGALTIHSQSYAYQTGKSVKLCAEQHVGSTWAVKLDLKDFFHQIDEIDVYKLFLGLRYSRLVSFELARLTTRLPSTPQAWLPEKYATARRIKTGTKLPYQSGTRLGYLPQGAPTSGALSNAHAYELDEALSALALAHRMTYTRYADDLSFSSDQLFSRAALNQFLSSANRVIHDIGFLVNSAKTSVQTPAKALEILGTRVDSHGVHLSKRTRGRIERHLFGIERHGIAAHVSTIGFRDIEGFNNHLRGLLNYAHDIEPERAHGYFARLESLFPALNTPRGVL